MAQSNENVVIQGMRGTIGGQLVFRNRLGKTVVSKSPKKGRLSSTEQLAIQAKFKLALAYAKSAVKNEPVKAGYQAMAKGGQTAFNVAFQDAYHSPELSALNTDGYRGQIQNPIVVRAIDNFKVDSVRVLIIDAEGSLVEQGNAVAEANGLDWKYLCTQAHADLPGTVIRVIARDLPGNETLLEKTL